jgi:hypothetical protein
MIKISLALAIVCFGCAGPRFQVPTVPDSVIKRVEARELPPDPAVEPIPDNIPSGDWVSPIEKGECLDESGTPEDGAPNPCPVESGLVISEERAYRSALYRIRYRELRKTYESDRMVWSAHRELYEERLKLAGQAIEDLQPNWWDRNKLPMGVVGGVVLGIATSVAILSVTDRQ